MPTNCLTAPLALILAAAGAATAAAPGTSIAAKPAVDAVFAQVKAQAARKTA
jgi:hypothetical protein